MSTRSASAAAAPPSISACFATSASDSVRYVSVSRFTSLRVEDFTTSAASAASPSAANAAAPSAAAFAIFSAPDSPDFDLSLHASTSA
eukprot:31232-Pelagococcus_subviridis.AAC.4